jgi:hypothetical protein
VKRGPLTSVLSPINWRFLPASHRPADKGPLWAHLCKILPARIIELLLTGTTNMRHIFMAPMVAALVGCATTRLSNEVKPYVGRDIHELAARLGNPTGMRESTGTRVYVWSTDSEGVLPTGSGTEGTRTGAITGMALT